MYTVPYAGKGEREMVVVESQSRVEPSDIKYLDVRKSTTPASAIDGSNFAKKH